jgi:hypothetical protein
MVTQNWVAQFSTVLVIEMLITDITVYIEDLINVKKES